MANGELIGSTNRKHSGKSGTDRRALGEMALSMRNSGMKVYSIALELGISEESAYRYMRLALDARLVPTVDEFRKQQNDALDERAASLQVQLDALDRLLTDESDPPSKSMILAYLGERRQTVLALTRVDERRAKLNGLDAPVRSDVTVTVHDAEDAELQEMIREARAAQANESAS